MTVALPKNATGPVEVRNGAHVYRLAPGESAEVPARIAPHLVAQGARTRKSRSEDSSES